MKKGKMNLALFAPDIASEWDYSRNEKNPEEYDPHSNATVNWVCKQGHRWTAKINNRVNNQSQCPYCAGKRPIPGETDLATLYPNIAKEWHPHLNGDAKPEEFLPKSNRYAWWQCAQGHEWRTKIYHRVEGSRCPKCFGARAIPGKTDLATVFPELVKYWSIEKNKKLNISEFLPHSHQEAIWRCQYGHEWSAPIETVVKSFLLNPERIGCPVCAGKILHPDNKLSTVAPDLCAEWDYEKNAPLTPENVTLHSNRTAWWKCRICGHSWQARIDNRASGTSCPACKHITLTPENSLAKRFPQLAKEWDYERNYPETPDTVAGYSNKAFWWICDCGHHWKAIVSNRSALKHNCPYCSKRKPVKGLNDLETLYPDIAAQWNQEKNGKLLPSMVSPNSSRNVWWICENGHEWQAIIYFRVHGSSGCPKCMGLKRYNIQ